MLKYILPAALLFSIACDSNKTQPKENTQPKELVIEGFSLPEGAVKAGEFMYISNVGVEFNPLDKDGDGFISRVDEKGAIVELKFLPVNDTMHSPKGMAVINNILYVTDIDRLKGYDLTSKEKVFDLDFSEEKTQLLNDITVKDDSTLFVSGMDIGKVFSVNVKNPSYANIIDLKNPNGLYWNKENGLLYVGLFGRMDDANGENGDIGVISFDNDSVVYKQLSTHQGNIDGVTLVGGDLYFTDWLTHGEKGGELMKLNIASGEVKEVSNHIINGAGDFYFDKENKKFWIPKMRENKVLIIDLE